MEAPAKEGVKGRGKKEEVDILELYDFAKEKATFEFDPSLEKMRMQAIFTFRKKAGEEEKKEKVSLKLGIFVKYLRVLKVDLLKKKGKTKSLKFEYSSTEE